ncbi:MAG: hypothetical protein KJ072_00240 [Verrucomicrobia bacterium]|nr:hypothetical protein [Verrucomicrobiota bacterium]
MIRHRPIELHLLAIALSAGPVLAADLTIAPYFGHNMVLQQARGKSRQARDTIIWGWGREKLKLRLELRQSAKPLYETRDVRWDREKSGPEAWKWTAAFRDLASGGPFTLRIDSVSERSGFTPVELQNVVIGEVWVLGQWLPTWSTDPAMPRDLPFRAGEFRKLEESWGPRVRVVALGNLPTFGKSKPTPRPWRELRGIDASRDGMGVFDLVFGSHLLQGSGGSAQYVGLVHLADTELSPRVIDNMAKREPLGSDYGRSPDWAFDACFKTWASLSKEYREFENDYRLLVLHAKRRGTLPQPARFPSWNMLTEIISKAQHRPHALGDLPGLDYSVRGTIWLVD